MRLSKQKDTRSVSISKICQLISVCVNEISHEKSDPSIIRKFKKIIKKYWFGQATYFDFISPSSSFDLRRFVHVARDFQDSMDDETRLLIFIPTFLNIHRFQASHRFIFFLFFSIK